MASLTLDDYTIAWICALPLEAAAARAMLDKIYTLPHRIADPNAYEFGELNGHRIVIAHLPNGVYGTVSAAAVVSRLRSTFPRLQFGLMVGIGGGAPSNDIDIRLGDVVVSKPGRRHSGVIQYDYRKAVQGEGVEQTGTLNKPPQMLLMRMSQLEAQHMTQGEDAISKIVWEVLERNPSMKQRFSRPSHDTDLLFHSSYCHTDIEADCKVCDKEQLVRRSSRSARTPYIHYGLVASGDQVLMDAKKRDSLARQHGILCFEMEAAGIMDELPTLVIRGICDYCDSHKQKQWQGYAALTAAAYAKLLLSIVPVYPTGVDLTETTTVRHWMVPLARNTKFACRQSEIIELEALLATQNGPRRIAITGLGGVGKTQVVLELVYRIRDKDKEHSIFWVPCTSYAMVEQSFLKLAQIVGLQDINPAEIKEQVKTYLNSAHAGKWLLIFDNADDPVMWLESNNTALALEEYLPGSENGRIVFTTRNMGLAVDLTFSQIISIPDEDQKTAWCILESLLLQKHLLDDLATTIAILDKLTYLPLAIAQASAYINKKRISLSAYLTLLQEEEEAAVELLSETFRDPRRYKDIENAVITTWWISFQQIQHQDVLAADYPSFMACINPRNIPHSLLPSATLEKKRLDAIGLLNAYSFTNNQGTNISMHRLVHMATRTWLKKKGLFSYWIERVAYQKAEVFPNDHYTNRGLWRDYLPHALSLVQKEEFREQQDQHIDLLKNIADCLLSDGRYNEAEPLYRGLLDLNQEKSGTDNLVTLTSMAHLATTYCNQGRWNEAEELRVQVMETSKAVLGVEHPDTLASMANLASTYHSLGRWSEAEELFVHVTKTSRTVLGAEHPHTLACMANLASTYQRPRRWSEAEQLEAQVFESSERVVGPKHFKTAMSRGRLAMIYWKLGKHKQALEIGLPAMERMKTTLGPDHPYTLTAMSIAGSAFHDLREYAKSEIMHIEVTEKWKSIYGPEHPSTLLSMQNMATLYQSQERWDKAETLGVQVMDKRRLVLGPEHPDTLISMAELAKTWKFQGKLQDSFFLLKDCFELRTRVLGADHPDTRCSSHTLREWTAENSAPREEPLQQPDKGEIGQCLSTPFALINLKV
ncbi:hypothetical protein BJY01DRAFT_256170 [Aspergillus pseudoustus]|uniref:AAA+ ATPase domain-containing protein n=1 Tax=Aspergillus pseudoustus TaxID=1810923 RepID=A0ABR4IG16_9EURO